MREGGDKDWDRLSGAFRPASSAIPLAPSTAAGSRSIPTAMRARDSRPSEKQNFLPSCLDALDKMRSEWPTGLDKIGSMPKATAARTAVSEKIGMGERLV
jgi:hypothetical protein